VGQPAFEIVAFGDAIPVARRQSCATASTSGDELRAKLPIWRVVGPVNGATYDLDGGQQLVS
jgi:hypothetical protein